MWSDPPKIGVFQNRFSPSSHILYPIGLKFDLWVLWESRRGGFFYISIGQVYAEDSSKRFLSRWPKNRQNGQKWPKMTKIVKYSKIAGSSAVLTHNAGSTPKITPISVFWANKIFKFRRTNYDAGSGGKNRLFHICPKRPKIG